MELVLEKNVERTTVWDDYVPIVKEGDTYNVYLTETVDYPSQYNKLVHLLRTAQGYETINLYINNGGGVIDSAFFIIDAIKDSVAHVVAYLSGTVASAATVITLACDELVVSKYLSFMIHNYSTGMQGKGHELKAYQNFTDRELNRAFKEIYEGFLTEDEMDKVIDGSDIWLNEEEVVERWANKEKSQLTLTV